MANLGKWNTPGSLTTVLSTGLDALGSSGISAASTTYTNDTGLDLYCDVEVVLGSLSPTAGAYVSLYVWESVDGTNFPAQSDADLRLTASQLLVSIPIGTTAATAQRVVARNILLPPAKIQFKLDNQTGTALAATGNTVKILPYSFNLNA